MAHTYNHGSYVYNKDSAQEDVGGLGSGPLPLSAHLNQGILLALQGDEVALGRRQLTNPCLGHLKIPHHLIKCAATTNALQTIHLLMLKGLIRRDWTILGILKNLVTVDSTQCHHLLLLEICTAPPLTAPCWLKEPVSNLVDCSELWSPPKLNDVFGKRHQLPLEGRD